MGDLKFSLNDLESRSYRDLQQLAKSLCLPSNVKKVHLIEMVHAKKFKTAVEVENIVQRVKMERRQLSQIRKNITRKRVHMQGKEGSSTNKNLSPPISNTPKHAGHILIEYSPKTHHTIMKYTHEPLLHSPHVKKTYSSIKTVDSSDRILRSFNIKRQLMSQASINSNILKVIKSQNTRNLRPAITQRHNYIPQETRINLFNENNLFQKVNVTAKCLGKKPIVYMQNPYSRETAIANESRLQVITVQDKSVSYVTNATQTLPVIKQKRRLSGIYPIVTKESTPNVSYEYIQSIGFRRSDGKISKINALVQKNLNKEQCASSCRNIDLTVQDLINSNIDSQNLTDCVVQDSTTNMQYPNMSSLEYMPSCSQKQINYFGMSNGACKENEYSHSSVYYHKKIRGEQIRSQRRISVQKDRNNTSTYDEERLPRINEVFSRFSDVHEKDLTQPIYVQVSKESERILNYPIFVSKANNTNMLESMYNFKNQFVTNQPLLQVATTTATKCVYSTPVIATAMAQASTATVDAYYVSPCERDSQCSNEAKIPRIYDFLAMAEQDSRRCNGYNSILEDFSTSTSPLDRSSLQQANIPEMVEDALEIISQDGDYLERIGMDVRMQCILCSWAGPRIILEYHIRKDHPNQIHKQDKSEWNITYTLGNLVQQQLWFSQVIEYENSLYVLSAKYEDPDYFMAVLTMLSADNAPKTATVTIYNKVSGEPYTWSGSLELLPPTLPYYVDRVCLKLEISRLNLLPNSANIKLLNRELVLRSQNKVVVGHPELNDIQIILFVSIFY
ncbi:unnamed protein product [Chilo suppressalis]|uniref:Uncharacterized protein n=1 Tax=Chilo suppressalis TaxID=168631 RepID=A0ABN8B9T9_CHISP|nr:hypothetical protein evm_003571 [Chilo suppressalis]CAH0403432.1 unnamed protein product [Chilo suppressalis]